ncbi:MAG: type II secretion system F family protein [Ruminococcus flavefaciens]|nr:type II secretion system F family protein [Eubacterium sp.]MCM1236609.1 type II secretion system F family protein [Ruminococcus flavefaciens]
MAAWGYVAIDKSGKEIKGSRDADSREQAARELKNQGLIVLDITEQNVLTKDISFDFGGRPTARDLAVFCRQFSSITRAGVTIIQTLNMLAEQTENARMQKAIQAVRADVEKGESFADSLARHPKVFPELLVQMVRAGEASGSLEAAMERMAIQFEKSAKTQALIKKAMIYPIVVALVALAVVIVMLVFVIPRYMDMFEELGTELPGITMAVVNLSNFIQHNWYIIVPVVATIVFAIRTWAKTNSGRHAVGKITLKIPAVRNLVVKSASALMARTLSTLLTAGVPLVEAVDIVANTMGNVWFKEALKEAVEQIVIGVPLSQPLQTSGLFPPMVCHMVRIGEEAGSTEEMLKKLADYYEEEVEMAVQSLMAAMEPMIIIVLACIVGVLIGAVMAPMVNLYAALDNL